MVNFYKKNIFVVSCLFICLFGSLLLVSPIRVEAADSVDAEKIFQDSLSGAGKEIGYDVATEKNKINTRTRIADIIGTVIAAIVSFIGLIFFVLIFMGALDIIGAGGNDEDVLKGKKKIKNGAIGILLIFAAYVFAELLLKLIFGAGQGPIFKL